MTSITGNRRLALLGALLAVALGGCAPRVPLAQSADEYRAQAETYRRSLDTDTYTVRRPLAVVVTSLERYRRCRLSGGMSLRLAGTLSEFDFFSELVSTGPDRYRLITQSRPHDGTFGPTMPTQGAYVMLYDIRAIDPATTEIQSILGGYWHDLKPAVIGAAKGYYDDPAKLDANGCHQGGWFR